MNCSNVSLAQVSRKLSELKKKISFLRQLTQNLYDSYNELTSGGYRILILFSSTFM